MITNRWCADHQQLCQRSGYYYFAERSAEGGGHSGGEGGVERENKRRINFRTKMCL